MAVSVCALRHIDPAGYVPHAMHRGERAWAESNCYVDVWIEVLHALSCDPAAMLPFVFAIDWDGDQFTFFKPPHEDLMLLYGVDVQELNVYRRLIDNACEQLRGGKLVLAEVDAFFLPDTRGTDYRAQHTKTTIAIQEIDREARALGYFHNSSYHGLRDADFVGLFRLDVPPDATYMPFFAEFVRTERVRAVEGRELAGRSMELLAKHVGRRPRTNPVTRFARDLRDDLERLKVEGLPAYHAYAFATIRQLGAASEFGALYLRWLAQQGKADADAAAADFEALSGASKSLILKTARAVAAKRPVDLSSLLAEAEQRWDAGMDRLAGIAAA